MKAQEIIDLLTVLIKEHGDLEVVVPSDDGIWVAGHDEVGAVYHSEQKGRGGWDRIIIDSGYDRF